MASRLNSILAAFALLCSLVSTSTAFSVSNTANNGRNPTTALRAEQQDASLISRRNFVIASAAFVPAAIASLTPNSAAMAAPSAEATSLLADLETVRTKLEPIPSLLQAQEWEKVRQILKTPPVNFLWNMGDSKNPVLGLAKATDAMELIELKDEISISLQMCDQLTYDNVFVYYQPGNGKVKVKEPVDLATKAMQQLDEAIQMAKEAM